MATPALAHVSQKAKVDKTEVLAQDSTSPFCALPKLVAWAAKQKQRSDIAPRLTSLLHLRRTRLPSFSGERA